MLLIRKRTRKSTHKEDVYTKAYKEEHSQGRCVVSINSEEGIRNINSLSKFVQKRTYHSSFPHFYVEEVYLSSDRKTFFSGLNCHDYELF